jgi:hypothetical protein
LDGNIRELALKLEKSPAVRDANPQAAVLARILKIAPEEAEAWYALLFALAVEAAAMTVLLVAETTTGHRVLSSAVEVSRPLVVQPTVRERIAERGRVIDWLRERAVPAERTTATTLEALHADYEAWCAEGDLSASSQEAFGVEFDRVREIPELAGGIEKRGNRYYGITLVGTVPRLPG